MLFDTPHPAAKPACTAGADKSRNLCFHFRFLGVVGKIKRARWPTSPTSREWSKGWLPPQPRLPGVTQGRGGVWGSVFPRIPRGKPHLGIPEVDHRGMGS